MAPSWPPVSPLRTCARLCLATRTPWTKAAVAVSSFLSWMGQSVACRRSEQGMEGCSMRGTETWPPAFLGWGTGGSVSWGRGPWSCSWSPGLERWAARCFRVPTDLPCLPAGPGRWDGFSRFAGPVKTDKGLTGDSAQAGGGSRAPPFPQGCGVSFPPSLGWRRLVSSPLTHRGDKGFEW